MAKDNPLTAFVGAALAQGRTRQEIISALAEAGWSPGEVEDSLAEFADFDFQPPVPAPRRLVSARDFFTYSLLFVALAALSVGSVDLIHGLLDRWIASEDVSQWDRRRDDWALASVVVFGPIWALLSRQTTRALLADPARHRSAIRRWTAALILLLAVLVLLGTLTKVVYEFLGGGADLLFLSKSLVTAGVAGAIFLAYRKADE